MSVRFRFDPFSSVFSSWSVFDENAQHIVWAENLYTSKCMDFQMKTHFGPLHHGPLGPYTTAPKRISIRSFIPKQLRQRVCTTEVKKKDLTSENIMKCWPKTPLCPFQAYFELLWIVLISFSLKFGKVSWINATFWILHTKRIAICSYVM